jgi:hypothetical protein
MGNAQSSASIMNNVVNKALSNVLISNSNSCSQNTGNSQSIDITDIQVPKGCGLTISGISQDSVQTPNFSCINTNNTSSALQSQFQTELKNQTNAVLSGLPGAFNTSANSSVINKLQNDITNNVNISNLTNCVVNSTSSQSGIIKGISGEGCPDYCNNPQLCIGVNTGPNSICDPGNCKINISNLAQRSTQAAVANCMSNNSTVQNTINTASNKLESTASSSNTGISLPSSGISGIVICLVLLCIVFGIVGFMMIQ